MTPRDDKQEPFSFRMVREFLPEDENTESEYVSDNMALFVGSVLLLIVVVIGLFARASS